MSIRAAAKNAVEEFILGQARQLIQSAP